MNTALRALNRFGLGARIGEPGTISDPRGWLRAQLRPAVARLPEDDLPTLAQAAASLQGNRAAQLSGDEARLRESRRKLGRLVESERRAALDRRLTTDTPYVERLVAFWSNHLCVSMTAKVTVLPFAGLYERQVIRPHVLGRFRDMVLASARHPAMLLYLDNARSIGPNSQGARNASRFGGQERGLNENYARELLELHTLGVDGGYGQDDVEGLAQLLTGWTLSGLMPTARPGMDPTARRGADRQRSGGQQGRGSQGRDRRRDGGMRGGDQPFGFAFRSELHEPGSKAVLGKTYREGGAGAGEQAIADLCAHPSTARFVATKLVRHFVADDPPARAVDEIAAVFQDTGGDLMQVSEALIDQPEAWVEDNLKFRTPQDWLVAVGRALQLDSFPRRLAQVLRELRHPLWGPQSPKGFDDQMGPWADPDSLMNRAELARTVAEVVAPGRVEPTDFLSIMDTAADGALAGLLADRSIAASERVALAIGGPEFQWR